MLKKLFLLICCGVCFSLAATPGEIGFWFDPPEDMVSNEIEGLALGLPIFDGHEIEGAAFAICGSSFKKAEGLQATFIGYTSADSMDGIQISFVNLIRKKVSEAAVQLGIFNCSAEKAVQLGVINTCSNNAAFQFGLLNINKNGFLPVMILFNFGKE